LRGSIPVVLRIGQVHAGGPNFNVVILTWTELKVDRGAYHVLPGLDIHIAHVNMVGRVHVLKRVGSCTGGRGSREGTIRPTIA